MNILRRTIIFHIPHSSCVIPDMSGFMTEYILSEINLLTDWGTNDIFNLPDIDKITANFSRIYCDVERLPDTMEPMYKKGMGICYTETDDGHLLRSLTQQQKRTIINTCYQQHHRHLLEKVKEKIHLFNSALIIDCHSFSSSPLQREYNQSSERPDICLGVDAFHTPPELIEMFQTFFSSHGFTVSINTPYIGTIVPLPLYQKEKSVQSIMIEINKRLYMNEENFTVYPQKIRKLHQLIQGLLIFSTEMYKVRPKE